MPRFQNPSNAMTVLSMIEALLNSMVTRLCIICKGFDKMFTTVTLDLQLDVVYKIPSTDFSWSYISETGRSFVTVNREHKQYKAIGSRIG